MASTYTSNSGIQKPGSGEQAGAWGATVNTNFDIIDRALSGVGAITLAGTTHTLSTTDGALSDGHFKVLVLGGSPTGTNTITISPNDQDKLYLVKNASGQTATFTQGTGGDASVADGETSWLFADGAGAAAEVSGVTIGASQLGNNSITTAKIQNDAVTADKVDIDVQTKSGTASVTLTSTAVQTFVKHSGTGTLSIGAGQYDGQTINIGSVGTMTLSWHGSSKGISLGSDAKLASGVYDSTAGYWFFSETVTS